MQTKIGTVVSAKMKNTIVVRVDRQKKNVKYKKLVKVSKKFYADDPQSKFKEGDTVTIYETRPLSKLKRWTVEAPTPASTK